MNQKNKQLLEKSVSILKRLHFKEEDIMVTGSLALDLYGLLPDRVAHDADFIIKMDEQDWRCLKLLKVVLADDEKDVYPVTGNFIAFKFNGCVLNIWKEQSLEPSCIVDKNTGVNVASVDSILKAKKQYGRSKDIRDINDICKLILQ